MRGLFLVAAFSCALLQFVNAADCENPGATFLEKDGCLFTCQCSGTNQQTACTWSDCVQTRDIPAEDKCEIGKPYTDMCNTCHCHNGSKKDSACTEYACN